MHVLLLVKVAHASRAFAAEGLRFLVDFSFKSTVTLRDPDRIWGPEQLRDETGLEAGLRLAQTSASRRLCTWLALR